VHDIIYLHGAGSTPVAPASRKKHPIRNTSTARAILPPTKVAEVRDPALSGLLSRASQVKKLELK